MGNVRPRPYKTSELKSRITNLAQTSVYQLKIQPPAGLFSLLKETGRDLDYNRAGENLELLCDSAVCLLYTSPSPRDLSTSRMPSSA